MSRKTLRYNFQESDHDFDEEVAEICERIARAKLVILPLSEDEILESYPTTTVKNCKKKFTKRNLESFHKKCDVSNLNEYNNDNSLKMDMLQGIDLTTNNWTMHEKEYRSQKKHKLSDPSDSFYSAITDSENTPDKPEHHQKFVTEFTGEGTPIEN